MATISDYPLTHTNKESYKCTNYRRCFNILKGDFIYLFIQYGIAEEVIQTYTLFQVILNNR